MANFSEKANFIWTVAHDLLRGSFKAHEYGDVILPFAVLRRLNLDAGEPQGRSNGLMSFDKGLVARGS